MVTLCCSYNVADSQNGVRYMYVYMYLLYILWFITVMSFNLNHIIATLSFYFDSAVKNLPANVIKVSAAFLKLLSFSLFD